MSPVEQIWQKKPVSGYDGWLGCRRLIKLLRTLALTSELVSCLARVDVTPLGGH